MEHHEKAHRTAVHLLICAGWFAVNYPAGGAEKPRTALAPAALNLSISGAGPGTAISLKWVFSVAGDGVRQGILGRYTEWNA